jgi:radical SAM protein with 4Fe4S-binding SPASM domain
VATLILKATERCNSNCYYCDVVRKAGGGASMSLEMLEVVFRRIGEYLAGDPQRSMEVVWHGGEPLLLGPDYYRAAWELQSRYCAESAPRIRHSIQTNLTCFHEGFVEPLRRLGINSVGTSFDPEPHVRGPGAERDTAEYNRRFMEAVKVLDRHGMAWGVIYVVTRRSLRDPLGVFSFLTNLVPTGGINFNPVLIYDQERRDIAVTPEESADFLGAIFPTWWAHRDRYPNVMPFRSLVQCIIEGQRSLSCNDSGTCTYNQVNIAPDGEASQCGRSSDWGILPYGNIREKSFAEILADGQRAQLAERVELVRDGDCRGCRFWEICHGGCPLDSWSAHKDFRHKSEWCEARRGFIEKYFEPVTGVRFEPARL